MTACDHEWEPLKKPDSGLTNIQRCRKCDDRRLHGAPEHPADDPSVTDETAAQRLADELAPFFDPSVTEEP